MNHSRKNNSTHVDLNNDDIEEHLSKGSERMEEKFDQMKIGGDMGEHKTYIASGGKHTFHGVTYQLKLLMLFIIRAMNIGYPSFSLATEMKDADKFDDVIFSYPKSESDPKKGRYYRFLQAKHTISDTAKKKIRAADLLNETDGDYSLAKYFQSYLKISRNKKLMREGDEIKDLIICTNMSFKFEDRCRSLALKENIFEKVKNEGGEIFFDDILLTELIHFKDDFQGKNEIVLTLKKSLIDLPKRFACCILNEKEYVHEEGEEDIEDATYQCYENALLNEVIDVENRRFHPEFVELVNLSFAAKHFHDALKDEIRKRGIVAESQEEETFWKAMKDRKLRLSRSLTHPHTIEQPEKVSKKFTDLVRRNMDSKLIQVPEGKSVIAMNIWILTKNVMHMKDGAFYLSQQFLNDMEMPGNLNDFRVHLKRQLAFFNIGFSELESFRFEISGYSQFRAKKVSTMDEEVEKFLKKLVFAVNQPNEAALDEVIMGEIKRRFNDVDAKYVYRSFLESTLNWMKEKQGRYYSHVDAQKLFDMLKKEILRSIIFELKDPVLNFIGRENELLALKEGFDRSKEKCCKTVICQSAAISGLGGIGKSELARKYAQRHRADYNNIIWINCESNAAMESSFLRLAFDRLGILRKNFSGEDRKVESIIDEVYLYFCGKTNLFIFDNANYLRSSKEQDDGLMKYLPRSSEMKEFHILITSRNQNWGDVNVLSLHNFTEMEALEFLRNSLGHIEGFNEKEAALLASQLNYFPLALQQAASYIRENNKVLLAVGESFFIGEYLSLLEKSCLDLLDYEFPMDCNDSYSKTTFTTWSITLKQIEQIKYGDTAIKFLNLMSYLCPDCIDVKWVSAALHVTCKIEIGSAVELLKQYSMISMQENNLNVHRLVQLVTRCNLKKNGGEYEVLKKVLCSAKSLENTHSVLAWSYASQYQKLVSEFSDLPNYVVDSLLDNDLAHVAAEFAQLAVVTLEKYLESSHESVLKTKLALGKALIQEGKYDQALIILEYVHDIRNNLLGEFSPETLTAKLLVATALNFLGKYEISLKIKLDALEKGLHIFGNDHQLIFTTKNNIASCLFKMGEFERALKYYEEAYEHNRKNLGENHEDTLLIRYNISSILISQGKFEESYKILCETSSKSKGKVNQMLLSKFNIGLLLQIHGKYEEAFKVYEEVFEIQKDVFGEYHPITLKTRGYLASMLFYLGQRDVALQIFIEVFGFLKTLVGCNHDFTLNSMSNIENAYREMGKFKEALAISEIVYAKRKSIYGEDNISTLYAKNAVAVNLHLLGIRKKSLSMFESIYRKFKNRYGERHYCTIQIKHNIALVLKTQKKFGLSLKIFMENYEQLKVMFGEKHRDTKRQNIH